MGFMVLDAWAQASNAVFTTQRYGDTLDINFKGRTFHLLKPSTYMNLSGNAVRYWMQKLDVPPERVMVICDDLNLPFGKLRMRPSGSDGGHNGLKNIEQMIQTQAYPRIRIGIGHEFQQGDQVDYVIGRISDEDAARMEQICPKVIEGVQNWALAGIERAMTSINSKNII
ncbi:MAG: aminoacyl-tRNA hydrolase [Bacteroidales bacterium]|nr:aminoacyl-tRNA hydrolase [Bacteroidales bacterium]